jgi:outer membrane protein
MRQGVIVKIRHLMIIVGAFLVSIGCCLAQATSEGSDKALTLQDCIQTALQNNYDIRISRNNVSSAKLRETSSKSGYYPKISADSTLFTAASDNNTIENGTDISVYQNVYDGGLREATVKGAKYDALQSELNMARLEQTLRYNVSKAYYEVLRAKKMADVADASVKYNEALKAEIQSKLDVGSAAQVDILPVEAQLASSKVSLLSAQNSVRTALIDLQNQMGQKVDHNFDVQDIDAPIDYKIDTIEASVGAALNMRPDIFQYKAATESAKAAEKIAAIALYPRPSISAQYQTRIANGGSIDETTVMGGLSFDIFDGGSNKAAYKEAQNTTKNAAIQEDQIQKDIAADVENAYLNLMDAKERLTAADISLAAANENYRAQQERYAQGLGITLDLLNAEVQVTTAESDSVQAKYDYCIAAAQMDYAIGK